MKTAEERSAEPPRPAYHIMVKPVGPACNLRCRYCFYTEKTVLFPAPPKRMPADLLELFIRSYFDVSAAPQVAFAWQGGEPTLAGLDFFEDIVALQRRHAGGRAYQNALQTNGLLLDERWCDFLARESFLVGLSLDGPPGLHDRYRVDAHGDGSARQVLRTLDRLRARGVEFNVLCSVTRAAARQPREVYRFLRDRGVRHMQFIPIVERRPNASDRARGLRLAGPPPEPGDTVMPWSVDAEGYGRFLTGVFDEWVRHDVGSVFVQGFEEALSAWIGREPGLCLFTRQCGFAPVLEHNGDLYACDHYVYPAWRLGNLRDQSLAELLDAPPLRALGAGKEALLPRACRVCEWAFACHGGCPKHRFRPTPEAGRPINWLCDGYRRFFRQADPALRRMADLIASGRPASWIMENAPPGKATTPRPPGRNAPCPCGSGRKVKHCCGARATPGLPERHK